MDLLSSILDQMEDALIVSDKHGEILHFNKAALFLSESILGRPIILGQNLLDLAQPSKRELVRNILIEIGKTKSPHRSFSESKSLSGTTNYLEFRYTPVFDEEGEMKYVHTFVRDFTEQKAYENKLATLAQNTSQLVEKANAVVIGLDTRGYITDWNEHCSAITGFEKRDVFAQKFADVLLMEVEKGRFEDLLSNVLSHQEISNYEIPVRTRTRRQATLLLNTSVRYSPSRQIIGVILIGQDVTELTEYRKSLEKKVEERTRELKAILQKEKEVVEMKSRFVSIASHEFRTPLSSIQHSANFIRKNTARISPEKLNEKLESIEKQIQHMTHLLDDVLTYNKTETGKIQLVTAALVLGDFITRIVDDVGHSTKQTHRIKVTMDSVPAVVKTDEKLLRSILINLLTNAIKFSPGTKQVNFEIKRVADNLAFTVTDSGIGIPEDELEKIFEPFLRGKGVSTIQGTGLGLSIVKKAVELLKGTIEVTSQPNEGTRFTVTVPEYM
jgi:PAS domain S-box-containing protein